MLNLKCECNNEFFFIWQDPYYENRKWFECQNCKSMYNLLYEKINIDEKQKQFFYVIKCNERICNKHNFIIIKNKQYICLDCTAIYNL